MPGPLLPRDKVGWNPRDGISGIQWDKWDSAGISGIPWDKWDSVGQAAQARKHQVGTDDGLRHLRRRTPAHPFLRPPRPSPSRIAWRDHGASDAPRAPDHGPGSPKRPRAGSFGEVDGVVLRSRCCARWCSPRSRCWRAARTWRRAALWRPPGRSRQGRAPGTCPGAPLPRRRIPCARACSRSPCLGGRERRA